MASSKSDPEAVAKAPQRRRGRDRVASLLDAAAAVFARVGYEAATMTEIAAKAGASIGSLYQFFPTKPLLADALYLRELDALQDALSRTGDEALASSCPLGLVADRLFAALIEFVGLHPALAIVADRRDADASRKAATQPGMREQLAGIMSRADPQPTLQQARYAAGLVLLMMKGAVAVRVNEDPDGEALIEDIRIMLRERFAGWVENQSRDTYPNRT